MRLTECCGTDWGLWYTGDGCSLVGPLVGRAVGDLVSILLGRLVGIHVHVGRFVGLFVGRLVGLLVCQTVGVSCSPGLSCPTILENFFH